MVKLSFIQILSVWLLLLGGCGIHLQTPSLGEANQTDKTKQQPVQWIKFGVILEVQLLALDIQSESEQVMRLEVVLDNGRSLLVEQPLSQAGELRVGDRVRVLQIGGYSRVTFWPYPSKD